jgi:hypothetical protein
MDREQDAGQKIKSEVGDDVVCRREALKRIAKKTLGAAVVVGAVLAADACYQEHSDYVYYYYYYY